jgi:uncharacterized membrane protein
MNEPTTAPVKPGYQTTEFWLTSAATLVGLLIASGIIPTSGIWPQIVAVISSVLSSLGYSIGRSMVKAA